MRTGWLQRSPLCQSSLLSQTYKNWSSSSCWKSRNQASSDNAVWEAVHLRHLFQAISNQQRLEATWRRSYGQPRVPVLLLQPQVRPQRPPHEAWEEDTCQWTFLITHFPSSFIISKIRGRRGCWKASKATKMASCQFTLGLYDLVFK